MYIRGGDNWYSATPTFRNQEDGTAIWRKEQAADAYVRMVKAIDYNGNVYSKKGNDANQVIVKIRCPPKKEFGQCPGKQLGININLTVN